MYKKYRLSGRTLLVSIALLGLFSLAHGPCQATTIVESGWDLFSSGPGTTFAGAPFIGVPLGMFDFGGTIGVRNVGNTDTIVQRLSQASVPGPFPPSATAGAISILLVTLQLVSAVPIDLGAGLNYYFITLQAARGGPSSAGEMTITFENESGGTFDSFFDVFFDVRIGSIDGPIIMSDLLHLTSDDVPWDRTPPDKALEINGVNRYLNGVNEDADFWPITPFEEMHPDGAKHQVDTSVPEPTTMALFCAGIAAMAARRSRMV